MDLKQDKSNHDIYNECMLDKSKEVTDKRKPQDTIKNSINKSIPENQDIVNLMFFKKYCKYNKSTKEYRPKAVKENIISLLKNYGIVVKYNELIKDVEIIIPSTKFTDNNNQEISLEWIYNKCVHHDFIGMSKDRLDSILLSIADNRAYHPVREYLKENYKSYDGKNHLTALCETIIVKKPFDNELKNEMIKTWLISCIAGIMNSKGIASQGILVLQGDQAIGKTTWFSKLVINDNWFKDGLSLDASNKDSVSRAIQYWIVELGELGSTLKRDIDSLKAFITSVIDIFRKPYARKESRHPRRTLFCGTVNDIRFLKDDTGNRRFWVLPCIYIDKNHKVDINQLWGQLYDMYLKGAKHYLDNITQGRVDDQNKKHEITDYVDSLIDAKFDFDSNVERYWLRSIDIFKILGETKNITTNKISRSLNKRQILSKQGRSNKTFYSMPKPNIISYEWDYELIPDTRPATTRKNDI